MESLWILVSEEPPPEDELILMLCQSGTVVHGVWDDAMVESDDPVTHWMYVPEL